MPGLLDFLGSSGGGLFKGMFPTKPTQGMLPEAEPQSLFSGNALIGLGAGIASGKTWGDAIGGGLAGMMRGREADRVLNVQRETLQYLLGQGVDPRAAALIVQNPEWMKEYGKAAISPSMQIAPDGTIIQSGPMGRLNVPGGVPISERMETTNPNGSKSPAFAVKPSLQNPSGSIVQPGAAPRAGAPGGTASDPTMSVSPRQIISEQSPQATSEQKTSGELLAKDYADIRMRSDAANKRISTLQRMSQLSPKAFEGAAAPGFQYMRSLLTSFGMSPGQVPAGEEFTALANKMVLDANNGSLGTGVSNADVAYIAAMNPAISQTKEGREQIIQTLTALAKRDQEIGRLAYEWKKQNGTLDGFSTALSQWAEQNPLFANREQVGTFDDRFNESVARPGDAGYKILKVR
jgi:hypothetical protein